MPLDPWYLSENFRVGPITGTPERNAEADRRAASLRERMADEPKPQSYDPGWEATQEWLYRNLTRRGAFEEAAEEAAKEKPAPKKASKKGDRPAPVQGPPQPSAEGGIGGFIRRMSGIPENPVQGPPPPPAAPPAPPAPAGGGIAALPPNVLGPQMGSGGERLVPTEPQGDIGASEQVTVDAGGNPFAPYETLYEQLNVPSRQTANPAQDKANAYAEQEMNRTRLLAQLAFASGLTAAGGPGWDQIGQGFANAANAYSSGHERYMKALQNSADRFTQQQDQQYSDELKKAETIADLYTTGEKNKAALAKEERLARDKQAEIVREGLELIKPGEFADPEEQGEWRDMIIRNTPGLREVIDISD